jgi:hypothetical protein
MHVLSVGMRYKTQALNIAKKRTSIQKNGLSTVSAKNLKFLFHLIKLFLIHFCYQIGINNF